MKALNSVLKGLEPWRRPVWVMRQAGRYLPEYRKVREQAGSFLALCYDPEKAAEVTLQPLRRYDFDAAILFSDILVIPHAMGLALEFKEGEGPLLETVADMAQVHKLSGVSNSWQLARTLETIGAVKARLPPDVGFIGFCGAPWTVASYMVEGGSSNRQKALHLAQARADWFLMLIDRLVAESVRYLCAQIKAGVEVVQIFDSWAGDLSADLLESYVVSPISRIVTGVRENFPGFPIIVFARGISKYHFRVALETAATAIGIEQGYDLAGLLPQLDTAMVVQGNMAPDILLGDEAGIVAGVEAVVSQVPKSRHVFNLGHGILPATSPEAVGVMLDAVRRWDERS